MLSLLYLDLSFLEGFRSVWLSFQWFVFPKSRLVEGKTENVKKKVTFTWNAPTHTDMLVVLTALCVFVKWICDVMSCRGKIEISIAFIKDFFRLLSKENIFLTVCLLCFSFCRFRRLATMAAINRWSKNSASRLRKKRSRDHSNAYSSHTGKWMLWVEYLIGCVFKRRKMFMRTRDAAWLRQLKIRRRNGEFSKP